MVRTCSGRSFHTLGCDDLGVIGVQSGSAAVTTAVQLGVAAYASTALTLLTLGELGIIFVLDKLSVRTKMEGGI